MAQKDVFLESEGDAWFARNNIGDSFSPDTDSILGELLELSKVDSETSILEIGCGGGERLVAIHERTGSLVSGIDPSGQAVEKAKGNGVDAHQGTAESLPFDDSRFDIVIFGFCLYLCDPEDLFQIASEANRVLKKSGWLLIKDFYNPSPHRREYHHKEGIQSHKMDFTSLFTWHPSFTCFSHKVEHHSVTGYTDDPGEWVATSVLRKNRPLYG
ncbi:MAG: class I SAM-dependent methyltransferase [Verrucomicrobiales bacterium]|nr:class I SAM-dependent methyltransferase [Verrucomicrobiales bacterium]